MNSTTTKSARQQSLFFRDLASPAPATAHRSAGRLATPGQAAAFSTLRRENLASISDPPPPPIFTLDDRADFSPELGLAADPPLPSPRTPSPPPKAPAEGSNGGGGVPSWWSAGKGSEEKGKSGGSPVNGVLQSGPLVMLPPPREVARPAAQRSSLPIGGGLDEEEWVTVYGFSPGDTNLVLREFEKCGPIIKHVLGPRNANWMHILYQNRYNARRALQKKGMQINSVLILGVKPVDSMQRKYLDEKIDGLSRGGLMVSMPPLPSSIRSSAVLSPSAGATPRLQYPKASTIATTHNAPQSTGAIASPAKSVVSKVMDLMFGI